MAARWSRIAMVPLLAGTVLVIGACAQTHDDAGGHGGSSAHPTATMPTHSGMSGSSADAEAVNPDAIDPADVMFAQMMIPHHEQAVVLAEMAQTRAASPGVRALAQEIIAAQQPEIDLMSGWLQAWGAPQLSEDEAMAAHGGHGMSGMLSAEVLDDLRAKSGAEFDQAFAEAMIEHHKGAIEMAQAVVGSANPDVSTLAKAIITTQQAEIETLTPIATG